VVANLYVTEQNAILRKTGDRLVVEKDGEELLEVPCLKLDAVLLFGNVQFTTQAAVEMLDHGIELALLSRSGRLRGQLTPPKAKNLPLRLGQYDLSRDEGFCLAFCREVVRAKVENAAAVLRRFRRNHPESVARPEIDALDAAAVSAVEAASIDSLRGIEGTAAARYFGVLPGLVPEAFRFDGRSRRPPRDPFNALISFGYVLVGTELQSLLNGMGFDPYLGFHHRVAYGRPSLALDLLEEFRAPLVDRFAAKLLNLGVLSEEDFVSSPQRGVYLGREGMKRFFSGWEEDLEGAVSLDEGEGEVAESSFRGLFRRQAERLARAVRGEAPYEGFRYPC
jgi:CRISPR-associated protein Cas1